MYRLPLTIALVLFFGLSFGQSPHGDLKIDCAECHNPSGWAIDYATLKFDHDTTDFELDGSHETTDCKACHNDLTFQNVSTDCISCHLDVHNQTVGNDCMRCHNSESWLVFNIPELHEQNGFPLIGAHNNLGCIECHDATATTLSFFPIGNECIQCHRDDYLAASNPNHAMSGFSTDCIECHSPLAFDWDAEGFNHDFFPLTGGHDLQDCSACHDVSNLGNVSSDCFACHMDDYASTTNPNHVSAGFPTDCAECHSTNPGWMPAILNHDFFPLTLGHDIMDCNACHINGNYNNTPTDCFACHSEDYASTTNPNHQAANFPTNCAACHTTNPGWMPANFNHGFFPLTLGHDIQDCTDCHINNNYTNTPTDCVACHLDDYNAATDPNHVAAQFPTDCVICHTTSPGWMPANFNHDGMYFPIYSGKHDGEWDQCIDCHINPNNYSVFTCITCHTKIETNDQHDGVSGYVYESNACFACHPNP